MRAKTMVVLWVVAVEGRGAPPWPPPPFSLNAVGVLRVFLPQFEFLRTYQKPCNELSLRFLAARPLQGI